MIAILESVFTEFYQFGLMGGTVQRAWVHVPPTWHPMHQEVLPILTLNFSHNPTSFLLSLLPSLWSESLGYVD